MFLVFQKIFSGEFFNKILQLIFQNTNKQSLTNEKELIKSLLVVFLKNTFNLKSVFEKKN